MTALTEAELQAVAQYFQDNPEVIKNYLKENYAKDYSRKDLLLALINHAIKRDPAVTQEEFNSAEFQTKELTDIIKDHFDPLSKAAKQSKTELASSIKKQSALMEKYMERYLKDLNDIKANMNGTNELEQNRRRFLQIKIASLKKLQKEFRNPKQKSLLRDLISAGNFEGNQMFLLKELHNALFIDPKDRENNASILKRVAGHFALGEELRLKETLPGEPVEAFYKGYPGNIGDTKGEYDPKSVGAIHFSRFIQENEPLASRAKKASQSLYATIRSKISGEPKAEEREIEKISDAQLKKSVQKDLDRMRELFIDKLNDLYQEAEPESDIEKALVRLIENTQTTDINAADFLSTRDKTYDVTSGQVMFIKTKLLELIDKTERDEGLKAELKEKVKNDIEYNDILYPFKKEAAPKANQSLIKKVDKQINALQSQIAKKEDTLTKIQNKIEELQKKNPQPQKTIKELTQKHKNLLASHSDDLLLLAAHKKVIELLSSPERTTQATSTYYMRNELNEMKAKLKDEPKNKGYQFLAQILDDTLKMHDPYYAEIKELDRYITEMEQSLKKKLPSEQETADALTGNIPYRKGQLNAAKAIRAILIPTEPPIFTSGDKDKQALLNRKERKGEELAALTKIEEDFTRLFASKGKTSSSKTLESIVNRVLNKKQEEKGGLYQPQKSGFKKR